MNVRRFITVSLFCLAALAVVATASGDVVQQGNLRVAFDGRLSPRELPRARLAPVTVHLDGAIRTVDGGRPPQLRRISVEINRHGHLYFRGLPSCDANEIQQTTTEAALDRCRPALVGRGRFAANVDFPDLPTVPAKGRVLVFNGRSRGRAALLLHLYGSTPVRATFVLPFKISRRDRGEFGTVLTTTIPRLASDLGYVTDIELKIGRQYRHNGQRRSFLSASCAAPPGFRSTIFDFSRATFSFANRQSVRTTLTRDCRVRRG